MIDLDFCRLEYRERPCLIPGCRAQPTAFCHHPRHRGMGSGHAKWRYDQGIPLCHLHHDQLDARNGAGKVEWAKHMQVLDVVTKLAPSFWERIRREAESELAA